MPSRATGVASKRKSNSPGSNSSGGGGNKDTNTKRKRAEPTREVDTRDYLGRFTIEAGLA